MEARTYELADVGNRFVALIIDSILVGIIGGVFGINVDWVGGSILGILLWALYQWYFLTQQNGQTPGKMVMKLRVIKTDGTPIEGSDAIVRYIGYLINSPIIMLGWLWAFFDDNNQGWHDKLANTYVVKARDVRKSKTEITV